MTTIAPLLSILALASTIGAERVALADTESVVDTQTLAVPAPSSRYSIPWQLRPVTVDNVVRVDSAAAVFNDANGNLDVTESTVLAASYHLTRRWAPTLRLGFVGNNAPGAARDGSSFVNPVAGATYMRSLASYQLALSWATTIPIGMGGGDDPDPRTAKTNAAALTARPVDSAMFDVNYLTQIVGADVAFVRRGFTAQAEATLLQGVRVRGSESAGGTDATRTQAAIGLHLGSFIGSHVSLGGDVRYQRWLSHPTSLDEMTGARVPLANADMNLVTVGVGVRLHLGLGGHVSIHPGLSYTRGLAPQGVDAPLISSRANVVQLDVPVMF